MRQQQEEKIEKYLDGTLSDEALSDFERQIAADPELDRTIQTERWMRSAAADEDWMHLRRQLQQADRRTPSGIKTAFRPIRIWAAAAAVVLLFAVWFVLQPRTSPSQPAYTAYFEPYPLVLQQRGDGPGNPELPAAYQAGDFQKAIPLLEQWAEASPKDIIPVFYLGIARLGNDEPEKAVAPLQKVAGSDTGFTQQASWYLALAWLGSDQPDKAKSQLESIVREKTYRWEKAQEMLNALR